MDRKKMGFVHKNRQLHVQTEALQIEKERVWLQWTILGNGYPWRQEWKEDEHNSTKHENPTV